MNKAIIIGNLGNDPEVKEGEGYKLCNFRVATSKKWKNKQGELQEETQWHRISVSNKLADLCSTYLSKGDKIAVEGEITYREHEGTWYTTIRAYGIEFLSTKGGGEAKPDRNSRTENQAAENTQGEQDLPF